MKTGYFDAIISNEGKPIAATVTVYLAATETKPTIWSDKEGAVTKDNPFQTDSYGRFKFFANGDGYYDIEISGTGITTYKLEGVSLSLVIKSEKARAWRIADQTGIPDQIWTKIQLNQENDPGNNFDAVTNFRFTVPLDGYYDINAQVRLLFGSFVANKRYYLSLLKNGVPTINAEICPGMAGAYPSVALSSWADLVAGDYLELYIWHNAGQDISIKGGWGDCFMSVHLLSV